MSVKESAWNKKLRSFLNEMGFKIDRIESHSTAAGIPDNAWVHAPTGKSGWLEVKEEEKLPTKIKFRPKQVPWLQEHWAMNGHCATIVHIKWSNQAIIIPGNLSGRAGTDLNEVIMECVIIDLHDRACWLNIGRVILKSHK